MLNAEEFRALTVEHPFEYVMVSVRGHMEKDSAVYIDHVDTAKLESRALRRYRPGNVVSRAPGPLSGGR